jgi:hypothetical protein
MGIQQRFFGRAVALSFTLWALAGCGTDMDLEPAAELLEQPPAVIEAQLTSAQHKARCDAVKSRASLKGITNALVYAGVAQHETRMGHCWSEATSACQGPYSSYCGGPVLAGAFDGPCSYQQGGLGMYQFDSGTYSQTLAEHSSTILTLSGNIDKALSFIINKVRYCPNTPIFNSEAEVITWINNAKPGTASYDTFMSAMAWCYNGCSPGSACDHAARTLDYKTAANYLYNTYGSSYWYGGGTGGSCVYGDGLYCGGNGVTGDSRTLYRCTSGSVSVAEVCIECERMPVGQNDRCKAAACPYGDGLYCGGNGIGGSTSTLYQCTAGKVTTKQVCANGCERMPVGQNDRCK